MGLVVYKIPSFTDRTEWSTFTLHAALHVKVMFW